MLATVGTEVLSRSGQNSATTMNILGEYSIPHSKRYEHTTTAKLRRFLDTAYEAFEKGIGSRSQFAGVEGFKPSDMDWVNKHRRSLPSMRLLYDEITERLVIKFVLNSPHCLKTHTKLKGFHAMIWSV